MIFFGIAGALSKKHVPLLTSLLILIMGIVAIALALFAMAEPIYIAMIIGICLIIEGVALMLSD